MPDFTQQDLFNIRQRVLDGEDIPNEEMREVITFLRADRTSKISAAKSTKKKKEEVTPEQAEKVLNTLFE